MIVEIARSAAEQAIAIDEVNDIVTEMDRTTQQNAAMVEQSTAASHSLSYETEQLAKSVITFRVGSEKPAVGKPRLIAAIHAVAR